MTCGSIISQSIPALQLSDDVGMARKFMEDSGLEDLPVIEDQHFKGILHLSDIDSADEQELISKFSAHFSQDFVRDQDFFVAAIKKIQELHINCLPVLNSSGEYLGAISYPDLMNVVSLYIGANEPGGIIILQMPANQFSISELGRIVESNNAKIIHLTTWTDHHSGELMVSIKLNKIDIQDILASFERYQYSIYQYFGENLSEETLKSNFDNLMNYLRL